MKMRFTRGGNGREWRKGRFHLIGLVQPTEADTVVPQACWGLAKLQIEGPLPDHMSGDLIWVPEGFALTVRCHACGGRYEALFDVRAIRRAGDPHIALETVGAAVIGLLAEEWVPAHMSCANQPKQHHVPVLVQDFLHAAEKAAREAITAGQPAPGILYLLDTTGRVFCVHFNDLEPSLSGNTERINEIAARHFVIREMVRARKIDLLAAVQAAEAWIATAPAPTPVSPDCVPDALRYPSRAPNRREVLSLMVATPTFARVGFGNIHRQCGVPDQGPGTVDPIEWSVEVGPSAMLDTLFATTDVLPQSKKERERGAGVRFRTGRR